MSSTGTAALIEALRTLHPSGHRGFEGLVAKLLARLTGYKFFLAASGRQEGRDARATAEFGSQIAIECKRYARGTALDERELVAELTQAIRSIPQLDLWVLIASREVPDQIEKTLSAQASESGIAFAILDAAHDSGGDLAALCAHFPDDVTSWLSSESRDEIQEALKDIRADAGFEATIARLQRTFSSSWMGFDHARLASHKWLQQKLSSPEDSRAQFGQHLAVIPEALSRTHLLTAVSAWFSKDRTSRPPLIIQGEEGDGKTWLAADWVCRNAAMDNFPLVLFVPAAAATTDVADLLSSALARTPAGTAASQWRKRIERWTNSAGDEIPEILLILDGVNEKFSAFHWRSIFASLESSAWRRHVTVVATCRAQYWRSNFSSASLRTAQQLSVPPFNDEELSEALRKRGVDREQLVPSILPLIRKPRYFDLAIRHREQLAESGDITVPRLLYEDWRDRFSRRTNTAISPEDFNDLLKRLAERARDGERKLKPSDVGNEFPILSDSTREELYSELVTGAY